MYSILGDGTKRTVIFKDKIKLDSWEKCAISISPEKLAVEVDGIEGPLDNLILQGIYTVISAGEYENTQIKFYDMMLRGVISLDIIIGETDAAQFFLQLVLLPNIVPVREDTDEQ